MSTAKKKIIVAMSGGVDSSVAAGLLAREGHDVSGVTLRLLPRGGEGFGCCGSPEDVSIAKRSAEKAGIPHYVLDYAESFEHNVINYFVNSYVAGETPNPCLACNKHIKFDKLLEFAKAAGASHVATGHYARVEQDPDGRFRLFEAADPGKDQSYVLYNFTQERLASTLFPVGKTSKPEIRAIAREMGMPNADKDDSQEICFVPNRDYRGFVKMRLETTNTETPTTALPGFIKDSRGQVLGTHPGVAFYTVGQRKGLNIGANSLATASKPMYVTRLDAATNTVVVGSDEEGLSQGLVAGEINWIAGVAPATTFEALVKIRYKHEPALAEIRLSDGGIEIIFKQPQRAVSPGQAAVFYRWDEKHQAKEVLGGGKILRSINA